MNFLFRSLGIVPIRAGFLRSPPATPRKIYLTIDFETRLKTDRNISPFWKTGRCGYRDYLKKGVLDVCSDDIRGCAKWIEMVKRRGCGEKEIWWEPWAHLISSKNETSRYRLDTPASSKGKIESFILRVKTSRRLGLATSRTYFLFSKKRFRRNILEQKEKRAQAGLQKLATQDWSPQNNLTTKYNVATNNSIWCVLKAWLIN